MVLASTMPRANRALRLRALPLRVRVFVLALLGASMLPPTVALISLGSSEVRVVVGGHPGAVNLASCALVMAALLAFEPPRSTSALAYARQLRTRLLELQSTFDAEHRRRPPEGKENENARVPSEP